MVLNAVTANFTDGPYAIRLELYHNGPAQATPEANPAFAYAEPGVSSFGAVGGDTPANPHRDPPRGSVVGTIGDGQLLQRVIDNAEKIAKLVAIFRELFKS